VENKSARGLVERTVGDCMGRVTHRLTLRIDGIVEIADAHRNKALVDPRLRVCLTPGAHVPDPLMALAVSMIEY
jgi:hypothetical protein